MNDNIIEMNDGSKREEHVVTSSSLPRVSITDRCFNVCMYVLIRCAGVSHVQTCIFYI